MGLSYITISFFYDFLPLLSGYTAIFVTISCFCYRVIRRYLLRFPAVVIGLYGNICYDFLPLLSGYTQYLLRFPAVVIGLYGNICYDFLSLLSGYTAIFATISYRCERVIQQYLLRFTTVVKELYNNICYDFLPL